MGFIWFELCRDLDNAKFNFLPYGYNRILPVVFFFFVKIKLSVFFFRFFLNYFFSELDLMYFSFRLVLEMGLVTVPP